MKKRLNGILTLALAFVVQLTFAQEMTITGTVEDETGLPLPGVNVIVEGTNRGVQTDFDGNYSIRASEGETLVFSYLGFENAEIVVGTNTTIDVTLGEDSAELDEVLVVAYGTSRKGAFTGSATQINAETLEKRSTTNVVTALDGAAAGVNVAAANGQPGSTPAIRIRGQSSFNSGNNPLYIVDGVQFNGDLSSINQNDIESLTVLKDAASTSLYGSRAANGVVMITTKSGKGEPKASINASQGMVTRAIPEYDRVNAEQYYPLIWESRRNSLAISGDVPFDEANQQASDEVFDLLGYNPFNVANDEIVLPNGQLNPAAELLYPEDLDWQEPLTRTGERRNVDFSYSGSSEKTDYFVSLGYLNEKGYIIKSDYQRISARANVNSQVKDWFKTGLNLSGSTATSNFANDGGTNSYVNPFNFTRGIAPIYPVHLHDPQTGEYILDDNGERIYDEGIGRVGGGSPGRHVLQETLLNEDQSDINSISARTYGEISFLKDFTFTFNATIDKRFRESRTFQNPVIGDAAPVGRATRNNNATTTVNYNQLLNYSKEFGLHSVEALLGHESFYTEYDFLTGQRQEQIVEGNIELINFTTTTNLNSAVREQSREGYFSRLNYNFDEKYYISGSYRKDASSRFERSVRWGDFYSVGLAWRIDKEAFLENSDWISLLKLRGSYGETGNDNFGGYYAYQALFSLNYNNAAEGGILAADAGNPNIVWETNIQSDVALEFGFFNDRISGTLEYYERESQDLLFQVPLPTSAGLDEFPDNIGSWVNSGFELDLNLGLVRNQDFSWDLNVNGSTLKNEITELPQEELINGSKKLVVGGDIFDYWLRDWYGVDPADGAGLYVADPELSAEGESDVRMIDGTMVTTNQNKAIYDFVGTATPDVFGAFTNTFRYKGFELGATVTYSIGGETYDTNWASLMHAGDYGDAMSTDILGRWQEPGDITDVPRLDFNRLANFGAASDRFLVSSTYWALRQAFFSYTLDADLADRLGLTTARIFAQGENLYFNTERRGMDIKENFNGTTSNRFTPSRILSLGVNLTF